METVPAIMRFIRAEMRRSGDPAVSVPQFRVLAFVHRHPGTSLADVADHLGVTPPTASSIVDRLVRRGLVRRVGHREERRRIVLTLTTAGARLFDRARGTTRRKVARLLAGLPADHLHQVAEGLDVLRGAFSGAREEVPRVKSGGAR
jgi:DNA-binding MarR family transcriptional regulator